MDVSICSCNTDRQTHTYARTHKQTYAYMSNSIFNHPTIKDFETHIHGFFKNLHHRWISWELRHPENSSIWLWVVSDLEYHLFLRNILYLVYFWLFFIHFTLCTFAEKNFGQCLASIGTLLRAENEKDLTDGSLENHGYVCFLYMSHRSPNFIRFGWKFYKQRSLILT